MFRTVKLHAVYMPAGKSILSFHKYKKDAVYECKKINGRRGNNLVVPLELKGFYPGRKP